MPKRKPDTRKRRTTGRIAPGRRPRPSAPDLPAEAARGHLDLARSLGEKDSEIRFLKNLLQQKAAAVDELARRVRGLEVGSELLESVARVTQGAFDPDGLLDWVVDRVVRAMRAEAGSLLLHDDLADALFFKVATGGGAADLRRFRLPTGKGSIAGVVFESGEPKLVTDVTAEPEWAREVAERIGAAKRTRSLLAVPLRLRDKTIGVLELVNRTDGSPFTADDLELLVSIGGMVAMVVENARLLARMTLENLKLSFVTDTAVMLGSSHEMRRVLNLLMEAATRIVGGAASSVWLLDADGRTLSAEVATGDAGDAVRRITVPVGQGIVGWVAEKRESALVPDVASDPRHLKTADARTKFVTKNAIAVPMTVRDRLIGVLQVLNKGAGPFTQADHGILAALAAQAAVAIEGAGLHAVRQRELDRMAALVEAGLAISGSLDRRALLRRILDSAGRVLDAEAASLFLVDRATRELVFYTVTGGGGGSLEEARLAPGTGIVGWVAEKGEAVLVPDASSDPRWFKGVDDASAFRTRSLVAVPMRSREGVFGVVEALNKRTGTFDESDLRVLQSLANQAGVAFENAHLYDELEQLLIDAVAALGAAIEARDAYTAGHVHRVMEYSLEIGREMALPEAQLRDLRLASLLHDVGKIGVREAVLNKPGRLDPGEWTEMTQHTVIGHGMLREIGRMSHLADAVRSHHEHFNGRGYPDGRVRDAIPLFSRIITVADSFDAMTSNRVYQAGRPDAEAAAEIARCSGTQFDPDIAAAFARAFARGGIASAARASRPGDP